MATERIGECLGCREKKVIAYYIAGMKYCQVCKDNGKAPSRKELDEYFNPARRLSTVDYNGNDGDYKMKITRD